MRYTMTPPLYARLYKAYAEEHTYCGWGTDDLPEISLPGYDLIEPDWEQMEYFGLDYWTHSEQFETALRDWLHYYVIEGTEFPLLPDFLGDRFKDTGFEDNVARSWFAAYERYAHPDCQGYHDEHAEIALRVLSQ